jgi:hypothetical protein
MGNDLFPISREQKIACLQRELNYRTSVYPRRVSDKRMSAAKADYEILVMRAILQDYEGPPK